ncbi:hypothetical protein NQ314_002103 [Rhamnusium bicolor]|uniref:DDE Tnp4 domain-containing protein n=1 Tax=Rhamnusium bicolor TaxID=1586634 RepID=A0AAV8ZQA0_9CUCU|nr:hypothetical protein NQ314_002103 [Rhamnusium bicolor]
MIILFTYCRGIALRFDVSKSTAWNAIYRICKALLDVNRIHNIIAWPSANRAAHISDHFYRRYGFPGKNNRYVTYVLNSFKLLTGIIGSIDGTHIKITAPKDSHVSYINRKGYHSVLLQGVCDHNKLFIDVYAGEAGSIHDYTLFLRSDLSRRPDENFYNDTHLIGDLAYKLTTKLIVGFKNFGLLTDRQKVFNKVLAKARAVIENAFALLKGRFRRLKFIETIRPDLLCLLIMSACILHNLCILHRDSAEDIVRIEEQVAMERLLQPNNLLDVFPLDENNRAQIKRNNIINGLRQERIN